MNPSLPQLCPPGPGKARQGRAQACEGHSQFLVLAVAAEQEGSAKLTIKAAKDAYRRRTWEPQALSLDCMVMASAGDLHCLPVPSPEGTTFQNTARRSHL